MRREKVVVDTDVGKHIDDARKMIKNQITRSDALRFVDMQNNVNAIILSLRLRTESNNNFTEHGKYCH